MSTKKSEDNSGQLPDKLADKLDDKLSSKQTDNLSSQPQLDPVKDKKAFHQFFSSQLVGILLLVVIVLFSSLWLLAQQYKFTQTLITEQLTPLKTQLQQQTYLINANKLIDELSHIVDANNLTLLQQALTQQSKKLALLESEYKSNYQQWFTDNDNATNLISQIESNHSRHELLKNNSLIQLDTLIDAINVELNSQQVSSEQIRLLTKVKNQLVSIVVSLKNLNLQTQLEDINALSHQVNEMFVEDYAKQLANQQFDNQHMADIVRDFIRFEDLILKHGLLVKWQNQLQLMTNYQKQLHSQQQQLQIIIDNLAEVNSGKNNFNDNSVIKEYAELDKSSMTAMSISDVASIVPRRILVVFSVLFYCVVVLLLLIRNRIKSANKANINLISSAIDTKNNSLLTNENITFYSAETAELIKKIEQVNSNDSEINYLALSEKNKSLEQQLISVSANEEKLRDKLTSVELDDSEKNETQLLLEYQRFSELHQAAIKQLVFLGRSSLPSIINNNSEQITLTKNNYLFQAYLQGADTVGKLSQACYYRYVQSPDAIPTLSEVNLAAQVQADLLNLRHTLLSNNNKLSIDIDKKIFKGVKLDAELFSEMFTVFIGLLLSEQTNKQVQLTLTLVSKNNGQQKIAFVGQVHTDFNDKKITRLPKSLLGFNQVSKEPNVLGDYFSKLLHFQHGDQVNAELTGRYYQLSFNLPLAITETQFKQNYPILFLPSDLPEVKEECLALSCEYFSMPIEVLLAVKSPEKFQRLQQLLQSMGLQTLLVSSEFMLQKLWRSGRFSVLLTEFECKPFTNFLVGETEVQSKIEDLSKGVFSLAELICTKQKTAEYNHWVTGELSSTSSVDELIGAMSPWTTTLNGGNVCTEKESKNNIIIDNKIQCDEPEKLESKVSSFDFNRYLKHQGSAELALFMLEEYTSENNSLVTELNQAFANSDKEKAESVIETLLVNSKILAADGLMSICQHWQTVLTTKGLNNQDKEQVNLLTKTVKVVQAISVHAETVV